MEHEWEWRTDVDSEKVLGVIDNMATAVPEVLDAGGVISTIIRSPKNDQEVVATFMVVRVKDHLLGIAYDDLGDQENAETYVLTTHQPLGD